MDAAMTILAIRSGTLDYKGCMTQFYERKHNFANDTELLPDIRQRGLAMFDDAIGFGVLTAIGQAKPIVTVLQDVLRRIGSLYIENQQRLEQAASDTRSVPANNLANVPKHIADEVVEKDQVRLLYDDEAAGSDEVAGIGPVYQRQGRTRTAITKRKPGRPRKKDVEEKKISDESTDSNEDADIESDSQHEGHTHRANTKRKPGRPKTKDAEEKRLRKALIARQKRKRSAHWRPGKQGRDPKRHLYQPLENLSKPSNLATATHTVSHNGATCSSPSSASASDSTGTYSKTSRTWSKRLANQHGRSANTACSTPIPSLIVKLNTPNAPNQHPATPTTPCPKHRTSAAGEKRGHAVKSGEASDVDMEGSVSGGGSGTESETTGPAPKKRRGRGPTYTFASFPLSLPHGALTPFHRGAIIALENVLDSHTETPSHSLLRVVAELEGVRPTVSDWEHVAMIRGGSWLYQVLRDVWEDKAAAEREGAGDVADDEVVAALKVWVGLEMERLGGVVHV